MRLFQVYTQYQFIELSLYLQWKTECDFIINVHNADINFEIYVHKRIHSTTFMLYTTNHTMSVPYVFKISFKAQSKRKKEKEKLY